MGLLDTSTVIEDAEELDSISALLRGFLRKAEFDRAVFFGILTKMWSLIAGPLTVILIAYKFTPELQGYYYTFGSILALNIFVELGLGVAIIQFASHEWSKLSLNEHGQIIGDAEALSKLVSLARIALRWYAIGGLIIIIVLSVGGHIFFSRSPNFSINWTAPWHTLCIFTGVNICLVPIWSLLEGCNQVSRVYAYRFWQGLLSSTSIWITILLGGGLWTASIAGLAILILATLFLRHYYRIFLKTLLFSRPGSSRINWRYDILPLQWRMALTAICGYFMFFLFTPVLFKYHGPVVAGQMGMTWSIFNIVGGISFAWFAPKIPRFGILIAQKKYKELDILFWRVTKITIILTAVMSAGTWIMICVLNVLNSPLANRLLSPLDSGLFLSAQVILSFSSPFSFYMRAHKKEPIVFISVVSTLLIGLSAFTLGKYYSATGMAVGYLLVTMIATPLVLLVWHRCRAEWHVDCIH